MGDLFVHGIPDGTQTELFVKILKQMQKGEYLLLDVLSQKNAKGRPNFTLIKKGIIQEMLFLNPNEVLCILSQLRMFDYHCDLVMFSDEKLKELNALFQQENFETQVGDWVDANKEEVDIKGNFLVLKTQNESKVEEIKRQKAIQNNSEKKQNLDFSPRPYQQVEQKEEKVSWWGRFFGKKSVEVAEPVQGVNNTYTGTGHVITPEPEDADKQEPINRDQLMQDLLGKEIENANNKKKNGKKKIKINYGK